MKYTYTTILFILFCGMNCNNGVNQETQRPVGYNLDRFNTEKNGLEAGLLELEYFNLKLERLSKAPRKTLQIENPNMGSTIIFNDTTIKK